MLCQVFFYTRPRLFFTFHAIYAAKRAMVLIPHRLHCDARHRFPFTVSVIRQTPCIFPQIEENLTGELLKYRAKHILTAVASYNIIYTYAAARILYAYATAKKKGRVSNEA